MPKAVMYDMAGSKVGEVELSEAVFGAVLQIGIHYLCIFKSGPVLLYITSSLGLYRLINNAQIPVRLIKDIPLHDSHGSVVTVTYILNAIPVILIGYIICIKCVGSFVLQILLH